MEDKVYIMKTEDGAQIEFSTKMAKKSKLFSAFIEDYSENELPVKEVSGKMLQKIADYLKHYENEEPKKIDRPLKSQNFDECVDKWDADYLNVDLDTLFELLSSSNYLGVDCILELVSAKIGNIIRGKAPEEIKIKFQVPDLSVEDEQNINNEIQKCIDDFSKNK